MELIVEKFMFSIEHKRCVVCREVSEVCQTRI